MPTYGYCIYMMAFLAGTLIFSYVFFAHAHMSIIFVSALCFIGFANKLNKNDMSF